MLSIEELEKLNIDTKKGISRCANKEDLYLKLVGKLINNETFDKLYEAIKINDLDSSFNHAHGLKGIITNLSITPLENIIIELTENLRGKKEMDYNQYVIKIEEIRSKMKKLL
jgi:HPt (histidine-containing phosphotransfer) domain-containing protein